MSTAVIAIPTKGIPQERIEEMWKNTLIAVQRDLEDGFKMVTIEVYG